MTLFGELEHFVHTHRPHGDLAWWAGSPSPDGYRVRLTCPCGIVFERWVLAQDAEH